MYIDEQTSLNKVAGPQPGDSPVGPSVLSSCLDENSQRLDKLSAILGDLEARLMPIRNAYPQPDVAKAQEEMPPTSVHVSQLIQSHKTILSLIDRVNTLLAELEV